MYYGLCSEVDAQLGRLFERLKEIGEWDKTLVVFTADHVRHPTHFCCRQEFLCYFVVVVCWQ